MKSFVNTLARICDKELSALLGGYSYSVYGGHTIAIEGGKLVSYSKQTITVAVKGARLTVNGQELAIQHYCNQYLVIVGQIGNVGVAHA